ncbi:hypothetical protein [Streptomyces sp. NPDC023327]|uniref:hypothetical protein n=1 Tax=Streptomyces sp. NPDC023327 TaxID=3157088 RepID=UPI0033E66485
MLSGTRTPWGPLLGVLLVVLGVCCGPARAAEPATKPATKPVAKPVAEQTVTVRAGESTGVPGCGQGSRRETGQPPAAPPRPTSAYELLPALHEAHAASGGWGAEQTVPSPGPERGPPPLAPPSPLALSILRV